MRTCPSCPVLDIVGLCLSLPDGCDSLLDRSMTAGETAGSPSSVFGGGQPAAPGLPRGKQWWQSSTSQALVRAPRNTVPAGRGQVARRHRFTSSSGMEGRACRPKDGDCRWRWPTHSWRVLGREPVCWVGLNWFSAPGTVGCAGCHARCWRPIRGRRRTGHANFPRSSSRVPAWPKWCGGQVVAGAGFRCRCTGSPNRQPRSDNLFRLSGSITPVTSPICSASR